MLALALSGNHHAQIFVSPLRPESAVTMALSIMERKVRTMQKWIEERPGYGGFLPWIYNSNDGIIPADGWENSVPALDNGEMIWGYIAVRVALKNFAKSQSTTTKEVSIAEKLIDDIEEYLQYIAKTAPVVFLDGDGYRIRAVSNFYDQQGSPFNVTNYFSTCDDSNPNSVCYLDDPYEGEMFAVFMYLYSPWADRVLRKRLWVHKRAKLMAGILETPAGNITAQMGWWFSAHEQWKYLALPYLSASPLNRRVFLNGERARAQSSNINGYPGLFASVTATCPFPCPQGPPSYVSATGISALAQQTVTDLSLVTPYGSFPLLLANLPVGLSWYNRMLQGAAMQNRFGSTESAAVDGSGISPVLTWDSKVTSCVAMLGGVASLVEQEMKEENVFDEFARIVELEWSSVFTELEGEDLPFSAPDYFIPSTPELSDFTMCRSQ